MSTQDDEIEMHDEAFKLSQTAQFEDAKVIEKALDTMGLEHEDITSSTAAEADDDSDYDREIDLHVKKELSPETEYLGDSSIPYRESVGLRDSWETDHHSLKIRKVRMYATHTMLSLKVNDYMVTLFLRIEEGDE